MKETRELFVNVPASKKRPNGRSVHRTQDRPCTGRTHPRVEDSASTAVVTATVGEGRRKGT